MSLEQVNVLLAGSWGLHQHLSKHSEMNLHSQSPEEKADRLAPQRGGPDSMETGF